MKFVLLAALALVNNVDAMRLIDSDVNDLFNDDSQEADTLASIQAAEKAHGIKLDSSIANDNMSQILGQKASVKFTDDDEFVKLEKRQFNTLNV